MNQERKGLQASMFVAFAHNREAIRKNRTARPLVERYPKKTCYKSTQALTVHGEEAKLRCRAEGPVPTSETSDAMQSRPE